MYCTISITNNDSFCRKNNLIGVREYACPCVDFPEMFKNSVCRECNGSGKVSFEDTPFELGVSGSSLFSILRFFKFKEDYSGSVSPDTILHSDPYVFFKYLDRVRVGCGISNEEYALYITMQLYKIAHEAHRRKEKICWC